MNPKTLHQYETGQLDYTYTGYLHNVHYCRETVDEQDIYGMLHQFNQLPDWLRNVLPVLYAIDYTTQKYIFVSESIKSLSGYHPNAALEGGLDLLINGMWEKNFFMSSTLKFFHLLWDFSKILPREKHHQYVFFFQQPCETRRWKVYRLVSKRIIHNF